VVLEKVLELMGHLPNARLVRYAEFEKCIWQFYNRETRRLFKSPKPNQRFRVNQRAALKPTWEQGLLKLGDTYTKVMLVMDYPNADANWFLNLANTWGCEVHVTKIINPSSSAAELAKSAKQTEKALESASVIGGENEQGKVTDHNQFRKFVADNNLAIFNKCYIIKLHSKSPDELKNIFRSFKDRLGDNAVISHDNEDVAFCYWRVSQIAQGIHTPFLRPDHCLQVANMAPIICFNEGDSVNRQMLRVTSDGKAITLAYPIGGTNHQITAAKTGSGKGVENVCKILETYPLGINYYITEVGASYKWVVEAFGGDYFHLNPNDTVISPFPEFNLANSGDSEHPLPSDIVAPTIGALMPLLAKGAGTEVSHHVTSVSEQVLQVMYSLFDGDKTKSPTLADFYEYCEHARSEFEGAQKKAIITVTENLDSFLNTTAGGNFAKSDSINFNSGIVGIDFKGLMQSEELAKFLLVFITLRFKQIAFANATPSRIMIDEIHEFERIDHDLVATLIKQLTRMGRKEAAAYHGISQEVMDSAMEEGILNQVTHREFMYLQSGHESAGKLFKMNDAALSRWKSFIDPEASKGGMDYRQCLRMVGDDCFDLHLRFPQPLLDLAHSSPDALLLKAAIGKETKDVFERLKLFREGMNA